MKKQSFGLLHLIIVTIILMAMASCSRGITPFQAANGKAKCGRWVR